jgi:predicted ATPase
MNNSGKSALILSILLISQTITDENRSNAVLLNGSFVKLGDFDKVKSHGTH